jgi:hypothetical protein
MSGDAVKSAIENAEANKPSLADEVERLATLTQLHYEQVRVSEAERLGVRVTVLDGEVEKHRRRTDPQNGIGGGQGASVILPDPDPWPEPVEGDELLSLLARTFEKYAVLPEGGAEVLALWAVHAHAVEAFYHSPRLARDGT